ncbi:adenomatous polyposis coli protein-like isoform X3 [Dysidea avara]|uniref:adenomatous polyposis coli protein-like isoform X3 n=1 Tax=Dysidea avara TaxID=196820 RepID=UPI0033323350
MPEKPSKDKDLGQKFNELHVKMTRLMQEMQANLGSQEDINRMEEHRLARINQIDRLVQQAQQFHADHRHGRTSYDPSERSTYDKETAKYLLSSQRQSHALSDSGLSTIHVDSDHTGVSSRYSSESHHSRKKVVHSPSTELGSGSMTHSSEESKAPYSYLPPFSNPLDRSISQDDNTMMQTPEDNIAAALALGTQRDPYALTLSQPLSAFYDPVGTYPTLSQPNEDRYNAQFEYHSSKPDSPYASSSENSSMASSYCNQLRSGPASEASFSGYSASSRSTVSSASSRGSNYHRLPRPPSMASSADNNSVGGPKRSHSGRSSDFRPDLRMMPHHRPRHASSYDDDSASSTSFSDIYHHQRMPNSYYPHYEPEMAKSGRQRHVSLEDKHKKGHRRSKSTGKQKGEEEECVLKLDMVLSILSLFTTKEQSDFEKVRLLSAMSQSATTCSILRQSGCINMLLDILHNWAAKEDPSHLMIRQSAGEILRTIVEYGSDPKRRKYELSVLKYLERLRIHSDELFGFLVRIKSGTPINEIEVESLQHTCETLFPPILKKLSAKSYEKKDYRPAILNLGGLQAAAELLVVNYRLSTAVKGDTLSQKLVTHSVTVVTVILNILVNLTYGDLKNKANLCCIPDFLTALVYHIRGGSEPVIANSAQILRNLSWRATQEIKDALAQCYAIVGLVEVAEKVVKESSIQHITSALWNLSAHSVRNREEICKCPKALPMLVKYLTYNSPSGSSAVVENVGGILRNISAVIMQEEEFRQKLRDSGCLPKLVQHLKSKNKVVLANACGILWNISARCPEDQKILWNLGCIPLLDVLKSSQHRNVAEYASKALRNLLAYGKTNGLTSQSDITAYGHNTRRSLYKRMSSAAHVVIAPKPHTPRDSEAAGLSQRSRSTGFPRTRSDASTSNTAVVPRNSQSTDRDVPKPIQRSDMGNFSLSQPSGPYVQYYDNEVAPPEMQDHYNQVAHSVQHINAVPSSYHDGSNAADHASKAKRNDPKRKRQKNVKSRVRYATSSTDPDNDFLSVSQTNFSEMPSATSFYNGMSHDFTDSYPNTNNNGDNGQVSFAGEGEAEEVLEQNGLVDSEDDDDRFLSRQHAYAYSFHSPHQTHASSEASMPVRPISANRPGSASSVKLAAKYTPVRRNSGPYSQSPTKGERNSYEFESELPHSTASQESYSQQNSQDTIVGLHQPSRLSLSNSSQTDRGGSDPKISDKTELPSTTEQSKKWLGVLRLPVQKSRKPKRTSQHTNDPAEDMKFTDL